MLTKGSDHMAYRIYLSASTQKDNIGVEQYGTEQDRMQQLADRIKYYLDTQNKKFVVFRNMPGWSLYQTVDECNQLACEIFIDCHSNAGSSGADGTEVYFHEGSTKGKILAEKLYQRIAPISPGIDRGVFSDFTLYPDSGLYVLAKTIPPAALVEFFYHSNSAEVKHYLGNIDIYAKSAAMAICDYFGEKWIEAPISINKAMDILTIAKIINSPELWNRLSQDGIQTVEGAIIRQLLLNMAQFLQYTK